MISLYQLDLTTVPSEAGCKWVSQQGKVPAEIHYELNWDMSDQIELMDLRGAQMVIQLL